MKHTFNAMSVKTAKKDGTKYLGKNGTQAWRVSIKVGEEWYGNMVWEEDMLPVKGREYNIELSENDGFKNWEYKLMSKKEQIMEQTQPEGNTCCENGNFNEDHMCRKQSTASVPTMMHKKDPVDMGPKEPYVDPFQVKMSRGAAYNLAFSYCLKDFTTADKYETGDALPGLLSKVREIAEKIAVHQAKFVNGS